jgi:hypothetical protein
MAKDTITKDMMANDMGERALGLGGSQDRDSTHARD